jgi:hypothetical protein
MPAADMVTVLPSPRRLISALRDVGYDFVGAVADLIDNSVAANATEIDIQVRWDAGDSWIRISDNGTGMDAATITEALRFGSERSYRADDLGKFGLGLKTASLSQCRHIQVASRVSTQVARIEARRFDLDRIVKDDRWEVEILAPTDRSQDLVAPLKTHAGTVVMWSQLDRLLGSRVPHGDKAQAALWDMVDKLEHHLGMVFHRFLEGEVPGRRRHKLVIRINGNLVQPWNPFAVDEAETQRLQPRDVDISSDGVAGVVTFEPYVLPAKDKFSSEQAFNRLSGPARWNQQQGFYIYRANRMIQSGGWSRMRAPDEHTKLARVALDFYPELDAAFGINIAKMRVNLPRALRDRLKDPVEDLIRVAKRAYSAKPTPVHPPTPPRGNRTTEPEAPAPLPKPTTPLPVNVAGGESSLAPVAWPPPPLRPRRGLRESMEAAATRQGLDEALGRIIGQLRDDDPEIAQAHGW